MEEEKVIVLGSGGPFALEVAWHELDLFLQVSSRFSIWQIGQLLSEKTVAHCVVHNLSCHKSENPVAWRRLTRRCGMLPHYGDEIKKHSAHTENACQSPADRSEQGGFSYYKWISKTTRSDRRGGWAPAQCAAKARVQSRASPSYEALWAACGSSRHTIAYRCGGATAQTG